jgi:hypothetical protein
MKLQYLEIPEELRALANWIVWRIEKRATKNGTVRETKVPYCARSNRMAKSNERDTWSGFEDAVAALKRGYTGLGFCLTPPYVGVDLDGCRVQGGEEPWAAEIIRELDSYSELSPSEKGVHVIAKGILPDGPRQKSLEGEHHGVGLYDAARGRYLTMTGCRIRGGGIIPERTAELQRIHARLFPPKAKPQPKAKPSFANDDELITRARQANDGGKFGRLWDGRWEGEYTSQSEADLALCMKLVFWTGRDAGRIDALFRRSGLMRDKWDRSDYREATIAKALDEVAETWKPRGPDQRSFAAPVQVDRVTPTLELLNACLVFDGRIQFTAVRRRGPMIIAEFGDGAEAIWHSMTDLMSFARSQAILAEATQTLIPTPPRRSTKAVWEPAVQWILRLAGNDRINTTDALREEFRTIIYSTWKKAKCPHTMTDQDRESDTLFFQFLQECLEHRRDPSATQPPRCCVWHDGENCYVHQPSLIDWLSTPSGRHKQYDWGDVRNALLLLDFVPEQVHRSINRQNVNVRLWRGPLDLLVDDEGQDSGM